MKKKKDYREKRNNITFRRKLIFLLKHILKNLEKTDIKEYFQFSHNGQALGIFHDLLIWFYCGYFHNPIRR